MILGIDTSSALTSVAVVDDDARLVVSREHDDPRKHAEVIGPLLAEVVAGVDPARIAAVACGVGPGPYTGLRVGIASAIALGLAWGRPVHGLCSLDAVAAAHLGGPVTVALDARRSEAYWARYDVEGRRVEGPRIMPAADVPEDARRDLPRAEWVARRVQALLASGERPRAGDVPLDVHGTDTGATADALAGSLLLPPAPLYLRRPDVTVASP